MTATSLGRDEKQQPRKQAGIGAALARHRWKLEAAGSAVFVLLALSYSTGASYKQDYVVLICTYALLALGMYIPFIMSGSLSLAYNAYLGIGAYACAMVSTEYGWSSLWGIPIAVALSAAIAWLLGMATKRLRGFYLAGVTLLFGMAFQVFLLDEEGLTGGATGMAVRRPTFLDHDFDRTQIMVAGLVVVWVVALLMSRLRQSPFGIVVRLRKDVPEVVESSGVNTGTISLVSLAVGAGIAALGGSLFGLMSGVAQPGSFNLHIIFLAIFMPLLGGQASPWGAVIGAVIVVVFTFELDVLAESGTLVFAIAILLVLRFAPHGLLGLLGMLGELVRRTTGRRHPEEGRS
ncbi:branched-chain amino acid ABC transporter permease [Nocardioides dongkuii]|uniref:branched-chain amino acid ABC transporter permease n=1 Tax=Nocardioides dongkuii TaxID=2760089 RepID=UPI0015F8E56C|nr:branched-chain amino acid ABC transporter permease [Nocardioides dongkuii]